MGLSPSHRRTAPRAFTLIEMLVALAITLIMMGAVVSLFGVISDSVASSRSALEMSDRLRAARNQLQLDLQGATATMQPPLRPENDEGYLEIIEGLTTDSSAYTGVGVSQSLFGDTDDIMMLTVRSRGAPFTGKYDNGTVRTIIESPVAEVIYFLAQNGPIIDATTTPNPTRLYTLYRRVLLVAPGMGAYPASDPDFYITNDVSARYDAGTTTLVPNTLGDLTKRENRFAHYHLSPAYSTALPSVVQPTPMNLPVSWPASHPEANAFLGPFGYNPFLGGNTARIGDDVILTNVLAFDVQVFDPGAPIFLSSSNVAMGPSDPGWSQAVTDWNNNSNMPPPDPWAPVGFGAYVDPYYGSAGTYTTVGTMPTPQFYGPPQATSGLTAPPAVYDTWSLHYENDGLDFEGDLIDASNPGDLGTNGLDDTPPGVPGAGVVDDITEYDTLPPYAARLRGIRVTIRVYEPDSQVVREAVVVQDFMPD